MEKYSRMLCVKQQNTYVYRSITLVWKKKIHVHKKGIPKC